MDKIAATKVAATLINPRQAPQMTPSTKTNPIPINNQFMFSPILPIVPFSSIRNSAADNGVFR